MTGRAESGLPFREGRRLELFPSPFVLSLSKHRLSMRMQEERSFDRLRTNGRLDPGSHGEVEVLAWDRAESCLPLHEAQNLELSPAPLVLSLSKHRPSMGDAGRAVLRQAQDKRGRGPGSRGEVEVLAWERAESCLPLSEGQNLELSPTPLVLSLSKHRPSMGVQEERSCDRLRTNGTRVRAEI